MLHRIDRPFCIESIGNPFDRTRSDPFDFRGESHDFIEIVYVCSGEVEVVEEEKVYLLRDRDMILHAPMEFHRIKNGAQPATHFFNLSITASGALPAGLFDGVFHLDSEMHAEFLHCFDTSRAFAEHPELGQEAGDALSAFLIRLCRGTPVSGTEAQGSALTYRQLVKSMQEAVYQNVSLEELARRNYISVSYVKKLFRRYANTSPKQFYTAMRAREAAALLHKGLSASAVAERMNFSSPNYFTAFFKARMGMTPSEYLRK